MHYCHFWQRRPINVYLPFRPGWCAGFLQAIEILILSDLHLAEHLPLVFPQPDFMCLVQDYFTKWSLNCQSRGSGRLWQKAALCRKQQSGKLTCLLSRYTY